jgi:hypothetical protein
MVLDTGFAVGLPVAAILWHRAFFKVILAQWIRSPRAVAGHIRGSGDAAKHQIPQPAIDPSLSQPDFNIY